LAQGEKLAREGKWNESRDSYAQVLAHPLLDWTAAEDLSFARCLSLHMGTVFVRSGDSTNHQRLCRLLLGLHPEKPTTPKEERDATVRADRYAKSCFLFARSLSPEMRAEALQLARFALEEQRRTRHHSTVWICQTVGIAEYYAGDPERAIELLLEAEQNKATYLTGPAMLFRAMALQKLNRPQEAAQVLQEADTMFSNSPELNSPEYWWDAELYKVALEQARTLIH
jgi:tetratricopeptide (TPR) repeat protein